MSRRRPSGKRGATFVLFIGLGLTYYSGRYLLAQAEGDFIDALAFMLIFRLIAIVFISGLVLLALGLYGLIKGQSD